MLNKLIQNILKQVHKNWFSMEIKIKDFYGGKIENKLYIYFLFPNRLTGEREEEEC